MSGVKQVIVIRRDLHMRRGKEIAQGAHASMAWLTERLSFRGTDPQVLSGEFSPAEFEWVRENFRKIVCQVPGEVELLAVYLDAKKAGLVTELIRDAGLTEFHGAETPTAVAVGPDYDERIDPVTGELELY